MTFYRTVLAPLGIDPDHEGPDLVGWDDFATAPAGPERPATRHLHLAFVAPSRSGVDAFWHAGIAAGHRDAGAPGPRPQYRPEYYGAFLFDPDGNSAEAVHHDDTRRGGHLDHLWIRVAGLDAAVAFYRAIARHTGLREGRRFEGGQQFRGAWATFTLVGDGSPPTEQAELAFPAPDRETVDAFHRAATAAGGRSAASPREGDDRYRACVLDPDANRIESVHRGG